MIKAQVICPNGQISDAIFHTLPLPNDVIYLHRDAVHDRIRKVVDYVGHLANGEPPMVFVHHQKIYAHVPDDVVKLLDSLYGDRAYNHRVKVENLSPSEQKEFIKILDRDIQWETHLKPLIDVRFDDWYRYFYNKTLEKLEI